MTEPMQTITCIDPENPSFIKNQIAYHSEQLRFVMNEPKPYRQMISIHRMAIDYWQQQLTTTRNQNG